MVSSRQVRVVRGAAAAFMATFVSLLSHVIGGGDVPSVLGVLLPLVLSLWPSVILAGRRLSLWRLSASVVVSQVLFHFLFVLGAAPGRTTPGSAHLGHAGHGGGAMLIPSPTASGHAAALLHSDPSMWLSHAAAALVTIAVLYRGERLLLRLRELASQLSEWLRRLTLIPAPSVFLRRVRAVAGRTAAAFTEHPELSPLRRRGPPPFPVV